MTVGVLSLQGAFIEHERVLAELGQSCVELRCADDLSRGFDRLVLPGGESTVQGRLLREEGMLGPLRERIEAGMPVLGTCAGLILLAQRVEDAGATGAQGSAQTCSERHLGTMPVMVRRNAYGRQLGSFHTSATFGSLGKIPMTFIRAPYILWAGEGVETLATVDGHDVAARYGNQIGVAFHPELDGDLRIHEMFLGM